MLLKYVYIGVFPTRFEIISCWNNKKNEIKEGEPLYGRFAFMSLNGLMGPDPNSNLNSQTELVPKFGCQAINTLTLCF